MESRDRDVVRSKLESLADKGVTIGAIDSQLAGIPMDGDEYDEMWLYAWSLLEGGPHAWSYKPGTGTATHRSRAADRAGRAAAWE